MWCHENTTVHTYYVSAWTTFLCGVEHLRMCHVICCVVCMGRITTHGVVTHVTATQGTCLGKYLTMPYYKNTMNQFFIYPQ